ncbi:hypothetical protein Tco_0782787 [Tanacetum coccineum]
MNALKALQPPTTLPATIPHFEENSGQSFSGKEVKDNCFKGAHVTEVADECGGKNLPLTDSTFKDLDTEDICTCDSGSGIRNSQDSTNPTWAGDQSRLMTDMRGGQSKEEFRIRELHEVNVEAITWDKGVLGGAKQWAFLQATIEKNKVEADRQFIEIMNALKALQPPTTLPVTIPRFKENSGQSFSGKEVKDNCFKGAHVDECGGKNLPLTDSTFKGIWIRKGTFAHVSGLRIAKTARTRLGQGISHVYERRM